MGFCTRSRADACNPFQRTWRSESTGIPSKTTWPWPWMPWWPWGCA